MPVHRIRLRKPWHCQPCGAAVVWQRRFNRPTGLGPRDSVFLMVEGLGLRGSIAINGEQLGGLSGEGEPQRFEVTDKLDLHNTVCLTLDTPRPTDAQTPSVPPADVCLEIVSR